jgi:hypothetical protein
MDSCLRSSFSLLQVVLSPVAVMTDGDGVCIPAVDGKGPDCFIYTLFGVLSVKSEDPFCNLRLC